MSAPVWLITGSTAGFGRAFVDYALSQGYKVVATARTPSKLAELVASKPEDVLAVELDVTKGATIGPAFEAAMAKFGRIDVVVNNAGYGIVGAVEETPEAELRAQLETNFFGAWFVTQAALPILRAQGSGAIVQISSLGGNVSFAGFGAYSASKFALEGMTEALATEVAPFNIKAMIVEPGAYRTDFAKGDTLKHMPPIDAYKDTVGGTRDFCVSMDNTQAGDPAKAAAAIDQALKAEKTPLRLVLGPDAVDAVRGHAEAVLKDIEAWETVARAAVIDGDAA
mmetsp:Transcript_10495/g.33555  ORF Transcript_10495/g.33555 Transcript_10495/m.33555 type:complete len:282 (-) Transcript_10495:269-1114(-)